MRSVALACLALFVVSPAVTFAEDEPVFSGPQPGEKLASFKIKNVLADPAREVDLIKTADGGPVLIVFVHVRNRPAFGLSNALMRYAVTRQKAGLTSGVVYLTDDPTADGDWMKRVRGNFPKGALYGISTDGIEGPGSYGLNRNVQLTILVGKNGKTTANFALVQPGLEADGPKIAKALATVLGDEKPADITKFGARMRKDKKKPQRPNARNEISPELANKLRAVINKDNTAEEVDKAAKALEEFLAKDEKSAKRVGEITNRIIAAGALGRYGTEKAREYLKKWAKEYGPKDTPDSKPKPRDKDKPAAREKPDAKKSDKESKK